MRKRIWPHDYWYSDIHLYSLEVCITKAFDQTIGVHIKDLENVLSGAMEKKLNSMITHAVNHVNVCALCLQKGFVCELCASKRVIYPFQIELVERVRQSLREIHIQKELFSARSATQSTIVSASTSRKEGAQSVCGGENTRPVPTSPFGPRRPSPPRSALLRHSRTSHFHCPLSDPSVYTNATQVRVRRRIESTRAEIKYKHSDVVVSRLVSASC